nr:glucan synthase 1-related protein [Kibdelosporangium sp. MJ126-NF4]CTQ89472.1 glucan synthase 1-related protein [Kibdelosporangium sp. MJ126-NF4]
MVAAVVVVGVVTVLLVANTEPGAGPRPTTMTKPTSTPTRDTTVPPPSPRPTLTVDSGCRIGKGSTHLVAVPRPVTDRVNRAWERIEKWLAAHAPATAATLAPPATLDQIAESQRDIGVPIPADLIAFLLRHDGAGTSRKPGFTLPPFYQPMSAKDIVAEAKMMCEVLIGSGYNESVGSWWHGQVVPFARDGGGGNLLLDQRPGHNGRLGDHDEESDMYFTQYPPTLTELLEQTATSLETSRVVVGSYRPMVVAGGVLDWDLVR